MIESIAVIFSLLSVILTTKKNQLCWPVGIIGVIFYGYIFYQNRDWSNLLLQFFFIIQSIYGWINWNKSETKNISSLETYERLNLIYIYFFFLNQLYLSSALYFLFLILATYGYFNWEKQIKQ